jgi:site-specific DNA-cytosine methylase
MTKRKAVGIHVFAGGFTRGVQEVFDVAHQLETHGFGLESASAMCGIECINDEGALWPNVEAEFAYGNPRCTGFSTITSGYDSRVHGPWAAATCDIHQFAQYTAGRYDIAIWESVQQAYTTGKPLLDYLRDEVYGPKHYKVAHVFVNAATFGNAQQRKRYFFVAYRDDRNFCVTPPVLASPYKPAVYDVLWERRGVQTNVFEPRSEDYDENSTTKLTEHEQAMIPFLPNGWDLNLFAQYGLEYMPEKMQRCWTMRTSNMPFSMHGICRINWMLPSPTLHSSAGRFVHPGEDRVLTIGELAAIMGWPCIPKGKNPVAQLAKGVVPQVGTWLAQQANDYLDGKWGRPGEEDAQDWESTFCDKEGEWKGTADCNGAKEKVFDLTRYTGGIFELERFDEGCRKEVLGHRRSVALRRETDRRPRHERLL